MKQMEVYDNCQKTRPSRTMTVIEATNHGMATHCTQHPT